MMLQKQQKRKRLLKISKHWEINSFANMVAKIDIDAFKISEQMRLKISKKLRTAGLNSNFNGSYKKIEIVAFRKLTCCQCWTLPRIRELWTQGFSLQMISYRKYLR